MKTISYIFSEKMALKMKTAGSSECRQVSTRMHGITSQKVVQFSLSMEIIGASQVVLIHSTLLKCKTFSGNVLMYKTFFTKGRRALAMQTITLPPGSTTPRLLYKMPRGFSFKTLRIACYVTRLFNTDARQSNAISKHALQTYQQIIVFPGTIDLHFYIRMGRILYTMKMSICALLQYY